MAIATPFRTPSSQSVSAAEQEVRVNLAALYRLAEHYGWGDLIYNHIAARVPGEDAFLMKPHNLMFDEVCASDLVKLPLDGQTIGFDRNVNPAGYNIHSAILNARPDANYSLHIHSKPGAAVSAQQHGILPFSQDSMRFYNRLSFHDFEGVAVDQTECERLAKDFGKKNRAYMLRNHGLLTVGYHPAVVISEMRYLVEACEAQLMLQASGTEIHLPPAEVCEKAAAFLEKVSQGSNNDVEWNAYLRVADRIDRSYRN
jgi:ribulose-5-phosphate 4-epimerase/fuculose-1-phosphate aldolase